ncbi:ATP-binding cassette domain-containing protein [Alkalibaculum sp. M08DMB]|uniref:ATP-binding cassette domain-containing protein n=1 Tax=Alkalibaculum sporogenes TaxID=2655001 RepID=A0A6A7K7U7_9FIRM|nr:ABC transporter ATP-binding protein [Alkalibaculum sporogenes]MPW25559.1 ATP-binding cassette domain-containing protein [Alkalibaculum sporogenes]
MKLKAESVGFSYSDKIILNDISLDVKNKEFVGIIGPNGSGKSTILKNFYGALKANKGVAYLDDDDLFCMKANSRATKLAVVGQEDSVTFDFKVEEIVSMGRNPHKKLFDGATSIDKNIIHNALRQVGMDTMAKRQFRNLSGGEKQRVIIARALAQKTDFLILDEPTNHLDISYQLQVLDLVKSLNITVLAAIHDLNMASLYCDRLYVLKNGSVYSSGLVHEILTPELIYEVYGVYADVRVHPITQKVMITYLPNNLKQLREEKVV